MSCLSPVSIVSKAIGASAKQRMLVPCGKCIGCLKDKQQRWVYRLQRENATSRYSLFVTLTYDPAHVPLLLLDSNQIVTYSDYIKRNSIEDCVMTLNKSDLTKFFKRLRKSGAEFRYYACGEYGDQFDRPHYHVAFFFDNQSLGEFEMLIEKSWQLGSVQVDPLEDGSIYYVTKYLLKGDIEAPKDSFCQPCYSVNSQGIGVRGFLRDYEYYSHNVVSKKDEYIKFVTLSNGQKIPVPRYYRQTLLVDEVPPFTIDEQSKQEQERIKNEKQKFDDYVEKNSVKLRIKNLETLARNHSKSLDCQQQARVANLQRRRRKGL